MASTWIDSLSVSFILLILRVFHLASTHWPKTVAGTRRFLLRLSKICSTAFQTNDGTYGKISLRISLTQWILRLYETLPSLAPNWIDARSIHVNLALLELLNHKNNYRNELKSCDNLCRFLVIFFVPPIPNYQSNYMPNHKFLGAGYALSIFTKIIKLHFLLGINCGAIFPISIWNDTKLMAKLTRPALKKPYSCSPNG